MDARTLFMGTKSVQVTGPSSEVLSILFSGWHLLWTFASWNRATSLLIEAMNDDDLLGTRAGFSTSVLLTFEARSSSAVGNRPVQSRMFLQHPCPHPLDASSTPLTHTVVTAQNLSRPGRPWLRTTHPEDVRWNLTLGFLKGAEKMKRAISASMSVSSPFAWLSVSC